jgi:small subunit ribosomal protein S16
LAVRIRLTRVGATKRPAYRVIAIDKRRSRDGRALEILGYYDPLTEPATLHLEREKIQAWIGKGAQPSETVQKLLRQAESKPAAPADAPKPRRATRAADAKPSKKARAKAAAPAEAPAVTADETPDAALAEEVAPAEEVPADAAPAEAEKAGGDAGSVEAADAEKADA